MMPRILFILIVTVALMVEQNFLIVPGTSINEPIIACVLALAMSPWLLRQFD